MSNKKQKVFFKPRLPKEARDRMKTGCGTHKTRKGKGSYHRKKKHLNH